jgi:membrane-associated protein
VSVFASLQVGSLISYVIAVVIPALDAIFPVLPSETALIALGVATAGSADPRIALLILCAAAGAFLGDNLCYFIGSRFGPYAERRFFSTGKGARRRAWAERSLQRFGVLLIIVCRFIPGGRTAVTLSCGLIGYPRGRFVPATAAAGLIWASYAFFLGRLGGKAFEAKPWAGFLVAFGVAIVLSALVEAARRLRSRRQARGQVRGQGKRPGPGRPAEWAAQQGRPRSPGATRPDQAACGSTSRPSSRTWSRSSTS